MKAFVAVALSGILCLSLLPMIVSLYSVTLMFAIFMYSALATSWNLGSGYTGYFSLGHSMFFGAGGYTFAVLVAKENVHWLLALILSGILGGIIALALGFILLSSKIRIAYFAMITLGLNEVVRVIVTNCDWLGGSSGIMVPPIPGAYVGYYVLLGVLGAVLLVTFLIDRGASGLGLRAILQDEDVASCTGINTSKLKIWVFVYSAFFTAIVGATVAWNWSYIDPRMGFDLILSFNMVIMAIFGGMGTIWGPLLGASFLTVVMEILGTNLPHFHAIIFGALVVLVVIIEPGGLMRLIERIKAQKGVKVIPAA
jgi:branched-chain amino acid transport system permease protein